MLKSNSSAFARVTAPGLPLSPVLYYDKATNRAVVNLRLSTWRSWGYAHTATNLLLWTASSLLGISLWGYLAFLKEPVVRGSLAVMGFGLSYAIAKPLSHAVFDGFLARQIFACRTKFWFTSQAIAFRSTLYENGVNVDRSWNNQAILSKFDICQDIEAADAGTINSPFAHQIQRRRQSACILRLIVAVASSHRLASSISEPSAMRAIPVLELDQRDAPEVATVLMAATALTSKRLEISADQRNGVDVDLTRR